MGKLRREARRQRQAELLSLFHQEADHYEEKEGGGRVYIKYLNGDTKKWQVAEYSKESFQRYKAYRESRRLDQELDDVLDRQHGA